jgi:Na+-driven multidrug efflux pump
VLAAAAFVPVALLALHFGWGVIGVWAGLDLLMVVRAGTNGLRFAGRRWALVGATA